MTRTAAVACEICSGTSWRDAYCGPVRIGRFGGAVHENAVVRRCEGCGAERLAEPFCTGDEVYEGTTYRTLLAEGTDSAAYFAEHDREQPEKLALLQPLDLRGANVADVGCAGGSFLDHIAGVARDLVAIEPCREYHDSLRARNCKVFSDAADALQEHGGSLDYVFSFSVIEHVLNPRTFLQAAAALLKPGGKLILSTPNRADVLLSIGPPEYHAFFYRAVHRWYFDAAALNRCAELAGISPVSVRYHHRFGLSNAMGWLRDRRPPGRAAMAELPVAADRVWRHSLEEAGTSDYLYAMFTTLGNAPVAGLDDTV